MNDFKERYKRLSEVDLYRIVHFDSHKYQDLAVEAAKEELELRKLTIEELLEVKTKLIEQLDLEENIQIKKEKHSRSFDTFLDSINPFSSKDRRGDKLINLIILVLGVYSVYLLINQLPSLFYYVTNVYINETWFLLFLSFELFALPVFLYQFWKRKKNSWLFLMSYLVYSTMGLLIIVPVNSYLTYSVFSEESGTFWELLPTRVGIYFNLTKLVLFGFGFIVLLRDDVKKVYNVSNKNVFTAISIGVGIGVLSTLAIVLQGILNFGH